MPLTREQLEKIQNQSTARKARAKEMSDKFKAPYSTVYIPEHNILVRFYLDSETEYIKTFWRHKFEKLHGQCMGRECEICQFLATLPDWSGKWKFKSREVAICYAYIDEYQGPESQYVKVQEPILLMGNYKLSRDLSECLVDLGSPEAINDFFDPATPNYRVKLRLRDKGTDFECSLIVNKKVTAPPLPEAFPPLSQCIYRPDQKPSDEMIAKFKQAIFESYEASQKKASEPPASSQSPEPSLSLVIDIQ